MSKKVQGFSTAAVVKAIGAKAAAAEAPEFWRVAFLKGAFVVVPAKAGQTGLYRAEDKDLAEKLAARLNGGSK